MTCLLLVLLRSPFGKQKKIGISSPDFPATRASRLIVLRGPGGVFVGRCLDLALVGRSVGRYCCTAVVTVPGAVARVGVFREGLAGRFFSILFIVSFGTYRLENKHQQQYNVGVPRTKEVRLAISTGRIGKSSPSPGQVRRITVQFGTISSRVGPCPGPNPTTSGPPSDCWQQQVAEDQGAESHLRGRSARAAAPEAAAAAADPRQWPGGSKRQARRSIPQRPPSGPPCRIHNVHGPRQQWARWPTFPTRASAGPAPGRGADGVWCRRVPRRRRTTAATTGCRPPSVPARAPPSAGAAPGRHANGDWRRGVRKRTAATTGCQRHWVLSSFRRDADGGADLGGRLGGIPCSTGGWVDDNGGGTIGFGRVSGARCPCSVETCLPFLLMSTFISRCAVPKINDVIRHPCRYLYTTRKQGNDTYPIDAMKQKTRPWHKTARICGSYRSSE